MAAGLRKMAVRLALASAVVVTVVLTALPALANIIEGEWPFYKPVELPGSLSGTALVEVEMDREVYARASPGLGDIRVTEQDAGREIPYKMLVESGDHRRSAVAVKMRDLGHIVGKYTTFVLVLESDGALHNEVEIQTSSANFQRRVEIAGSDDGETWRILIQDGMIFGLTVEERAFTTRDTRVTYPASTAGYLRVRIFDDDEEPLSIQGGVVFFAQQLQPRRAQIPLLITGREEDPRGKRTVLLLDAGSSGFPVNRIDLEIPQRNFHRQVSLHGGYNNLNWFPVQNSKTIFDFDTPKFVGQDLTIRFGESRYRYYRLTIHNEDNPPLPVDGLQGSGFLRKLIFSAEAGKQYKVYYGHPEADAPSYELERLFPYLVTEDLPVAQLGVHTLNPAFSAPSTPPVPFTERYPWLLPTIVAIAALLVGAFLATLVRQIGSNLRPPGAAE